MNQIIECHHCGAVNVVPEGEYFGGICECCSSDVYAAPEPEDETVNTDDQLQDMEYQAALKTSTEYFEKCKDLDTHGFHVLTVSYLQQLMIQTTLMSRALDALVDATTVQLNESQLKTFYSLQEAREIRREFSNLPTTDEEN
ncbi:MAG: hypothetical protein ACTH7R_10635 [Corynebacterium flavescens]|uniref:hypothetical protein n=1 Tax=Corynebacterium flavescens TaxID=28028 RepID=UPI003F8E1816